MCSLLPQHEELYRHYPNLASHHVPNYNAIADICNYALMKREAWFIQLDMSCCPFHDPAKIEAFGLMPTYAQYKASSNDGVHYDTDKGDRKIFGCLRRAFLSKIS